MYYQKQDYCLDIAMWQNRFRMRFHLHQPKSYLSFQHFSLIKTQQHTEIAILYNYHQNIFKFPIKLIDIRFSFDKVTLLERSFVHWFD